MNDNLELLFEIVIGDNEVSQYMSKSEVNVSFFIDVFGDWQGESILFYVNDELIIQKSINIPENGWDYSSKNEWSHYGVCISCNNIQNGYSTYNIKHTWNQMINSLFKR